MISSFSLLLEFILLLFPLVLLSRNQILDQIRGPLSSIECGERGPRI